LPLGETDISLQEKEGAQDMAIEDHGLENMKERLNEDYAKVDCFWVPS